MASTKHLIDQFNNPFHLTPMDGRIYYYRSNGTSIVCLTCGVTSKKYD